MTGEVWSRVTVGFPPFLKGGGNPIFEFFKKEGNHKKILGWGKKGGERFSKIKGGEPNFVS